MASFTLTDIYSGLRSHLYRDTKTPPKTYQKLCQQVQRLGTCRLFYLMEELGYCNSLLLRQQEQLFLKTCVVITWTVTVSLQDEPRWWGVEAFPNCNGATVLEISCAVKPDVGAATCKASYGSKYMRKCIKNKTKKGKLLSNLSRKTSWWTQRTDWGLKQPLIPSVCSPWH